MLALVLESGVPELVYEICKGIFEILVYSEI